MRHRALKGTLVGCTRCFIVSFMSFHVYFDKQVHKKLGEKKTSKQKKKIKSLNFAESNVHQQTNARGSFETYNLFLFSLIKMRDQK